MGGIEFFFGLAQLLGGIVHFLIDLLGKLGVEHLADDVEYDLWGEYPALEDKIVLLMFLDNFVWNFSTNA